MITLRPFQEEAQVAFYNFRGRCLCADEQGLGKTIEALAWIRLLPKRRPALIVTPASIKYAWMEEALMHFKIRARVLEGRGPGEPVTLDDDVLILNYDILDGWLKTLLKRPPKILVLDECHMVKNPGAKRTKAARIISRQADSVLALSGTPMTNHPIELWSVLNILRPDIFPDFSDFAWRYTFPKFSARFGWTYKGVKHKQELHEILLRECMIRRLKKDVAPELPDKTIKMLPIKLSNFKEYKKARDSFIEWLKERPPARGHKAKKAEALVKVGYLFRICAKVRLNDTLNLIRDFSEENPGEKLVGLTGHTFIIDALKAKFPNSSIVDGRVTGRLRMDAVRKFHSPKVPYFWGNWRAAGTGLNLQVASHFLSLDPPWTPGDFMQCQDRIHRIGQTKKVVIYFPYAMDTIEEKWLGVLQERGNDFRSIIDGEDGDGDSNSFTEQLIEAL